MPRITIISKFLNSAVYQFVSSWALIWSYINKRLKSQGKNIKWSENYICISKAWILGRRSVFCPNSIFSLYWQTFVNKCLRLNTWYMTNSTLVSPVKMEYGWNFSISGLKMMMKSGLGKIFLKFLHALTMLILLLNLYFWSKFSNKNDMVSAWRNFKNIFPKPHFIIIFRPEMLNFHPYSILTGDTRVEFVIYHVLSM